MFDRIRADIQAALDRDPAARGRLEVLFCYPGLHAVVLHRVGHWLWQHRLRLMARCISHMGRFLTGV
jgi:serine O-acetyltransferase